MRVVIDTNVLISATTQRDPEQHRLTLGLMQAAVRREVELLVPQCSLFEFVYVLSSVYSLTDQRIQALVRDLLAFPGLSVIDDFDAVRWLELWSEVIRDPNDAAVAAAAVVTNSAVATFDRKLARRLALLAVMLWEWERSPG